ncbi:hypothetical protein SBE55_17615 [Mycolicibacterium sp. 141076]|uniref:hypothetical protein n=1 Tax=Mycobacteriaceae TaxID=1762 RepID=UPI00299DB31B|nr:hypothetical protein [Mycolicibacterium sp. 141076]MDX1879628.1 hypothetical protein [Mycolicibacterium sp. 141076]
MSENNNGPDALNDPQGSETGDHRVITPDDANNAAESNTDADADNPPDGDTFPREYVEKLRKESAGYRDRADAMAKQLHKAMVSATGKLVNPDELPFDHEHLTDPDKLNAAIDALTNAKPYLRVRPTGDIGQGQRGNGEAKPTWGDLFRT